MKKMLLTIGIVVGVVALLAVLWFLFVITGAFSILGSNPPRPEITYGEFPINITYEVNGETQTIEDTVICEFDGIESRGTAGKYRKWKAHLKSGNNSLAFFPVGQDNVTIEVGIFRGSPNYYMGDFEQSKEEYERVMADDRYCEYVEWKNGIQTGERMTKDEVWEKYQFRILDIRYSPPIENRFK